MSDVSGRILYEDNHLIVLNKECGELVQGDNTGDTTLADKVKEYLKVTYRKPGNVYLGIPHRLDRPTSGVIVYAKTGKALSRLNRMFRDDKVKKSYHAIVSGCPERESGTLVDYLVRNPKKNRSFVCDKTRPGAKYSELSYRVLSKGDRYSLIEVDLKTGRHHQIRAQLAARNLHIKGDLKYGSARSNPGGGICLHARSISFIHPVKDERISVTADYPESEKLWRILSSL